MYQQTHHSSSEQPVSLLPLLAAEPEQPPAITHLILGAIHLNQSSPDSGTGTPFLTLNDHLPTHPRFTQLWDEVLLLQDSGVRVMCMLGGAAQGSFKCLDYNAEELALLPPPPPSADPEPITISTSSLNYSDSPSQSYRPGALPTPSTFERFYTPLRDFLRLRNLDGIDLDVEEPTSLPGIIHLLDRLRSDFGPSARTLSDKSGSNAKPAGFTITLAPVATALIPGLRHLSGFSYFLLERLRGASIDWYNTQFYNGWGSLDESLPGLGLEGWGFSDGLYDYIVRSAGWRPERVVVGLLTNPRHGGSGYVGWEGVTRVLAGLLDRYPAFAGVSGWEYWMAAREVDLVSSAVPRGSDAAGGEEEEMTPYWRWAWRMRWIFALKEIRDRALVVAAARSLAGLTLPTLA